MRPFLVAFVLSALAGFDGRAADLRNFEDAALHAIQFVDEKEGWAVGDEGVVWHTVDGGQIWERQPTGVRASLRSLHFLNPYTGWIAGREELPHGQGSVGVLLLTRDGGLKWQRVAINALPGLNCIRFVDVSIGFAAGDGTDQYPTGLFRTTDAGRTWQPLPGPRIPSWFAADFQDQQTGALAGAWSRLSVLRQGMLTPADVDVLNGRAVRGLQILGKRAVAVCQGGLIFLSRDTSGARWSYADLKLPTEVRACLDFHAVHCVRDHVWVVGRPGSVVLHSPDRGESWEVFQTAQPLPLNGVCFANAQLGWAVGELGTILGTCDGGKSWRIQHRGGQRAALLFLHTRATGLPLDTVALQGGEEGYLAAGLRVLASDSTSASPAQGSEGERFAAAMRLVGGAAGEVLWQFPMPQHLAQAEQKDILRYWNSLHSDRAKEELVRQLVLGLRIWRPSVVVTDQSDARASGTPAEALLVEALHEAAQRAADPQAFSEHMTHLGLEPWAVAKVYSKWDTPTAAQATVDLTQAHARLEATLRDFAAPAAALLADSPTTLPSQRYFHLLESRIPGAATHRALMQGIDLAPGGVARRKLSVPVQLAPELERAIRTRRNLEALAEMPANQLMDPNRMLSQVGPMLAGLPDGQAAPAIFAVANRCALLGQWPLARELFRQMVDRYPAHPLSVEACRWLIRYHASSEARRRQELSQFWIADQMTVRRAEGPDSKLQVGANAFELPEAVGMKQKGIMGNQQEIRGGYQECLDLGTRLAAFGPFFAAEPSTQFCLQAARRHLGDFEKAKEWYAQFVAEHADGPWREAAAAELWLMNRSGLPPKPVVYCRHTATRPYLDGELDDECWQVTKPLPMRNAVGDTLKDYPTEVRLAYDKDFLYLALCCRHPADRHVEPVKVRPHDADLRAYDRVSLLLDVDRDYSTYFHLQVDQRGCVCEDCWGDLSWNPNWFVSIHSEKDCWQIEAAIPMIELTGDAVTTGRAWACNVVRVIPGRGVQAWSLPAEVQTRPEGMGLLIFGPESDAKTGARPGERAKPQVP